MRYENGKNVLYLIVLREIYGCIGSVSLWYTTLEGLFFEIKPYGKCVEIKVI